MPRPTESSTEPSRLSTFLTTTAGALKRSLTLRPEPGRSGRLGWADTPAMLLSVVSALTAMSGARLLRGQSVAVMFALGFGVSGAGFVLKKHLVDRLSEVRPRQSLVTLVGSWLPILLFSTFLSTLATFSWLAPELAHRDADQAFRSHWTLETEKTRAYQSLARAALQRRIDATQIELDAEQRRVSDARRDGTPYPLDTLRDLRRRQAALRDHAARIVGLRQPPVEPPIDRTAAFAELNRAFQDAQVLHTSLAGVSPDLLPPAAYAPFDPPAADLQHVLFDETRKRTWQAMVAWAAALWVEALPFFALYRGGTKVPLATRIREWRRRLTDISHAVNGTGVPDVLPIVIEPFHVCGVVRAVLPAEFTLVDCTPFVEEAVQSMRHTRGSGALQRISNADGQDIDVHRPLLPQLRGKPLVLNLETLP